MGRNPAGGFSPPGPLGEESVSKGAGSFGFCPCVTCAGRYAAINKLAAEQRAIFVRIDAIDKTFLDSSHELERFAGVSRMPDFGARFHWTASAGKRYSVLFWKQVVTSRRGVALH